MLTSIHPLGERARHNRWPLTAGAFVVGAVGAGSLGGALLGASGSFLPGGDWRWVVMAAAILAAGAADLAGVRPPGPRRQVNEDWIGSFRGWVYGAAFGAQLGAGLATYVVTWGVWATALVALVSGGAVPGAMIGAAFGVGRSLFPLAAGWIDRPSRLTSFSRSMARAATPVARAVGLAFVVIAVGTGMWGVA
ncbi:MAG: hypothetical protein ACLFWM_14825 [Actinomycetota bacterium]